MIRILVVDKNPHTTNVIAMLIEGLTKLLSVNIETTEFNDWARAVDAIQENGPKNPFDLIITTLRIPHGGEGLMIIKSARENSAKTRIIVMSGNLTINDRKESAADEYLEKPFKSSVLTAMIRKLLPDLDGNFSANQTESQMV